MHKINHNQNLFLIVSYCFSSFGEFAKVIERQVWRVRVVHLHSAARALSISDSEQIVKKICFVVFCAEILQQISPTFIKRLLTSCMFLSHSENLHCENKINKEFWLNQNLYSSHRNFSDYFCCIHIFSAKLLICSQTLINLKHIQKPGILYVFDVRFHVCFTSCAKHASAEALIHRTTDNLLDFYTNKTKQYLRT